MSATGGPPAADAHVHSQALALAFLRLGTTRIRTHVDVDTEAGLRHLDGVLATREALAGRVDIQIVAFPQSGLLIRPGTAELLDRALAAGADVLGGLDPCAIDRDPARSWICFSIWPSATASRWTYICTSPASWGPSRST